MKSNDDGDVPVVIRVEIPTRNLGTIAEVATTTTKTAPSTSPPTATEPPPSPTENSPPINTNNDAADDADIAGIETAATTTARSSSHSVRLPKTQTPLGVSSYSQFKTNLHAWERHRIIESRRRAAEAVKEHQAKMDEAAREMDLYERRVIRSFSERWSKQFPVGQRLPRGYTYSRAQSAGSVSLMPGSYRIGSGAGSALPHFSRNAVGSRLSRSVSAGAVTLSSCVRCSMRASHSHGGDIGQRWMGVGLPKVGLHPFIYVY